MDPTIDSSPLKRFCTFWLGLATFALFGVLGLIAYKATGGNSDPAYAARADQRSDIREASLSAQAVKLAAAPIDLAAAAGMLAEKKVTTSTKPAPGTKAFEEWMAAQAAEAAAAAAAAAPPETPAAGGGEVTKLHLDAIPGGVMKYKQTELTVKAGAKVVLTFVNPDIMQHNFLLLKPGTKEKVGALADALLANPDAMKMGFIPESDDILAHTKLVNPAGTEILKFTAPAEPGDYPYICTFPGHWRLMFGTLKVTP
jgi:azurin